MARKSTTLLFISAYNLYQQENKRFDLVWKPCSGWIDSLEAETSATASLMGVLLKSKSIEVCLSFYKLFSLHCTSLVKNFRGSLRIFKDL